MGHAIFCDSDLLEMHEKSLGQMEALRASPAFHTFNPNAAHEQAIEIDRWITMRRKLDAVLFSRGLRT